MVNQQTPVRTGVLDFIQDTTRKQFVIPVYQRNYTWSANNEVKQLLKDLEKLLEESTNSHFIGMIMYIEKRISVRFSQLIIIDGQQRLTTVFLILLAIRKICHEKGDTKNVEFINDSFILNTRESDENKLKLKPLVNNDDVFIKLITEREDSILPSELDSKILLNYKYSYETIKTFAEKYQIDKILEKMNSLQLIAIPLEDTDNPQQVFESINSTGAPLTSADLIRNYVLMNNDNETQEHLYNTYWKEIERFESSSDKLEEIFRFYLAVKNKDFINKKKVYESFKDYWDHDTNSIDDKMKDILNYVRYYQSIYVLKNSNSLVNETLIEFRKNPSKMPAPFLMEIYRLYDEKIINETTFSSEVKIINSYLIRRWLCNLDTSSVTRFFPSLLKTVFNECNGDYKSLLEITKYFLVNCSRNKGYYMPTDTELEKALSEENAYSLRCIRPVLERIENFNNTIPLDLSDLSIEHIMPQTPDKDGYWFKTTQLDAIEYDYYVNLLGNLTLCSTSDNSSIGNKNFETKKEKLRETSHLKINQEILKEEEWNQNKIAERTNKLANTLKQIYPYYSSAYHPLIDNIICLNNSVEAKAIFHNQKAIEVLAGSTMKPRGSTESVSENTLKLFDELMENGTIAIDEEDENTVVFQKNYVFSSLSTAASFILQGSRNGWSYFVHSDGTSIEDLRNKE